MRKRLDNWSTKRLTKTTWTGLALTDLPKSWGAMAPPGTTPLQHIHVEFMFKFFDKKEIFLKIINLSKKEKVVTSPVLSDQNVVEDDEPSEVS